MSNLILTHDRIIPLAYFLLISYWCQNNIPQAQIPVLVWSGLEKYHSCIFEYIFIHGLFSSSVCSIYRVLGLKWFGTCCNLEHFYCLLEYVIMTGHN